MNPGHDWLVGLLVLTFFISLFVVDFRSLWAQFWGLPAGGQNARGQRQENANQVARNNEDEVRFQQNDANANERGAFQQPNQRNGRDRVRITFDEIRFILRRNVQQIWTAIKTNHWETINRNILFGGFIFPLLRFYQRTIFFAVLTVIIGYQLTRNSFLNFVKSYLFGMTLDSDHYDTCLNMDSSGDFTWNLFFSCLNSSSIRKSFVFYLIVFRVGAAIAIILNIIELIWAPFTRWINKMQEEIKEEFYTVGKVLQNHPEKEHLAVKMGTAE